MPGENFTRAGSPLKHQQDFSLLYGVNRKGTAFPIKIVASKTPEHYKHYKHTPYTMIASSNSKSLLTMPPSLPDHAVAREIPDRHNSP